MEIPAGTPAPGAPGSAADTPLRLHATSVAVDGHAVLIAGAAGAGKSSIALQMLALGAQLVSDDITCLWRQGETILADAPDTIRGRIEARGVGILNAHAAGPSKVAVWVDLDTAERDRLPPLRDRALLGITLPLLHNPETGCFPAAIMQYLRHGRYA